MIYFRTLHMSVLIRILNESLDKLFDTTSSVPVAFHQHHPEIKALVSNELWWKVWTNNAHDTGMKLRWATFVKHWNFFPSIELVIKRLKCSIVISLIYTSTEIRSLSIINRVNWWKLKDSRIFSIIWG